MLQSQQLVCRAGKSLLASFPVCFNHTQRVDGGGRAILETFLGDTHIRAQFLCRLLHSNTTGCWNHVGKRHFTAGNAFQ